jgi:hypothetical protein
MGLLGGLVVKLGADSKGYNKTMTKAAMTAKNVGKSIKRSFSGKLVGMFGAAALTKFAKDAVDAAAKVDHLSRRLGIGTEDFQKLDYAAKLSGSTTDQLATSLQRVDEAQGRLAAGNRETAKAFQTFGISVDEAMGIEKAELFRRVGDELKGVEPTATQKRAIQALFGAEAGLKNIRMFTEGLDEMMQTAADSGTVMADEQIRMAADFQDQLAHFKAEVMPIFLEIATRAMGAAVTAIDHIKIIVDAVATVIIKTQEMVGKVFDRIKKDAKGVVKEVAKIAFNASPVGMAVNLVKGKHPGEELKGALDSTSIGQDLKDISKSFSDSLTDGFLELEKKQEAREAKSIAAREKSAQDAATFGSAATTTTKVKADALARIGGFRGGINPEVSLLKRQLQLTRQLAQFNRRIADNTESLK